MEKNIYITKQDQDRLLKLMGKMSAQALQSELKDLREEIKRATIVEPQEIPSNVITMNSKVLLEDVETGKEMTRILVYPDDANLEEDRISIFSPIGTALIGYVEGDIIKWPVPSGVKEIKVKNILFQPEAGGDYAL